MTGEKKLFTGNVIEIIFHMYVSEELWNRDFIHQITLSIDTIKWEG